MLTYCGSLHAGDRSVKKVVQPDSVAAIELFDGIQSKQLEVKVIALGSHRANVIIENKTQLAIAARKITGSLESKLVSYTRRISASASGDVAGGSAKEN